MANANDPQGIAAERIRLNAQTVALSSAIVAGASDSNGLRDLQIKNSEAVFRLNTGSSSQRFDTALSLSGFMLEQIST